MKIWSFHRLCLFYLCCNILIFNSHWRRSRWPQIKTTVFCCTRRTTTRWRWSCTRDTSGSSTTSPTTRPPPCTGRTHTFIISFNCLACTLVHTTFVLSAKFTVRLQNPSCVVLDSDPSGVQGRKHLNTHWKKRRVQKMHLITAQVQHRLKILATEL